MKSNSRIIAKKRQRCFPFTPKEGTERQGETERPKRHCLQKQKEEKANRTGRTQQDVNMQGWIFKGTPQDALSHETSGIRKIASFSPA